ncbi:MAG: UDP-4-amino-4-deoxy-L-arabinose--oxoglutarate aminotransferase [Candidatus Syntrophoarchaeum sp. GoM_oil]|nr:MAG: UDP-4-amino-4-deoxy-L-arabinose--oxoglutarate aminotransferase [Candidatus Syntrophoarchaeum sp. GoM_oil]
MLGYNFRMMDIQAAIGLVQLRRLEGFNDLRIKNAEYLNRHLKQDGLETPLRREDVKHVYHQYAITIEDSFPISRDALINYLKERGIGSAVHYPLPVHRQPLYQGLGYRDEDVRCPVSLELSQKILSLPIHPSVGDQDLRYIVDTINRME